MPLESYITLFIALFILAYKPGPGFFLNVSYGVKEGFLAAFSLSFGFAVVVVVYFALSIQTYAWGTALLSSFIILVKGAGAAFLVYMGGRTLSEEKPKVQLQQVRTKKLHEYFLTGLFLEIGNPISIVFFLTLIPTLVPIESINSQSIISISIFAGLSSLLSLGSISLISAIMGKKFIKNEKFFYYLHTTTGLGLILIGLFIAGSAVTYVLN